jgi:hypothetical protein
VLWYGAIASVKLAQKTFYAGYNQQNISVIAAPTTKQFGLGTITSGA